MVAQRARLIAGPLHACCSFSDADGNLVSEAMTSYMLDEEGSYSGDDEDYGLDGLEGSSQHSQDWQEQQQLYGDVVQQSAGTAGEGRPRSRPADSQQLSNSSARRGKRKGAYTEEERRYRRRLANRCGVLRHSC